MRLSKILFKKIELPSSTDVHNRRKVNKEASNRWYKKPEKREGQEIQNSLTPKSRKKTCKRKNQ